MKCTLFKTVKSGKGQPLTLELFERATHDLNVAAVCAQVAQEPDHYKQQELKKALPMITWNAWFEGQRKNEYAHPSGLFLLDVDGVENPFKLWSGIVKRYEELGILLAHKTPSGKGLRLVCKCRPEFTTIDECQQWLAKEIGVEHDPACKDWARASYVVPSDYIYFQDGRLFTDEPEVIYEIDGTNNVDCRDAARRVSTEPATDPQPQNAVAPTFKGIPLSTIAHEWLMATGGEPEEGVRNMRLHALAYEMRYITDFNEQKLLAALPSYGLGVEEMKGLIHSACNAPRSKSIPKQMGQVLQKLQNPEKEAEDFDELLAMDPKLNQVEMPTLPPLFRQIAATAPEDFKMATVLCMLPILGTLGSKIRARYLDGHLHSPSFQVSLEAPQASGKSFMNRLSEYLMMPVTERDKEEREKEQAYNERIAELKVTGVKVTQKNKDDLLGQRPKGIIRFVPATISITKLLMRLDNARGLHLFAVAEEIDTVTKAFKRGFSSYGDLLRVAFDNGRYGQDYASDTSFSGIVNVYYNTLFSGTPKAMRRFYPDVEDGLVSRVCFVQLPDQFGKPMPEWGELSEKDQEEVVRQMERLDTISIQENTVQPDHIENLDFLNRALDQWLKAQQQEAVRTNDRTRDIFCRRSAVVGFRAGMLAWFLYGEKDTATYRRHTVNFARWIATQMLNQHLLRFQIESADSNTNRWEDVYKMLKDEFTRDELQQALNATGTTIAAKQVVYRWKILGCIESTEVGKASSGNRMAVKFRKVKR